MPTISRFYGVTISMYYNDHSPPHFHAKYGKAQAVITISPVKLIAGSLPARAKSMVIEWAKSHRARLSENWERCRRGTKPAKIEPLE